MFNRVDAERLRSDKAYRDSLTAAGQRQMFWVVNLMFSAIPLYGILNGLQKTIEDLMIAGFFGILFFIFASAIATQGFRRPLHLLSLSVQMYRDGFSQYKSRFRK